MAFIFPNSWDDEPIWLSYFQGVGIPPIRYIIIEHLPVTGPAKSFPQKNIFQFLMINHHCPWYPGEIPTCCAILIYIYFDDIQKLPMIHEYSWDPGEIHNIHHRHVNGLKTVVQDCERSSPEMPMRSVRSQSKSSSRSRCKARAEMEMEWKTIILNGIFHKILIRFTIYFILFPCFHDGKKTMSFLLNCHVCFLWCTSFRTITPESYPWMIPAPATSKSGQLILRQTHISTYFLDVSKGPFGNQTTGGTHPVIYKDNNKKHD